MNDLKPCPFCGGKAHLVVGEHDGEFSATIYCTSGSEVGCFAIAYHWALKKQWAIDSAKKAWNRRAPSEPPQKG